MNRQRFFGAAGMGLIAAELSTAQRSATAMTQVAQNTTNPATLRQFKINTAQADLDDLRRRIATTRWPQRETVTDDSQGVPLAVMQELQATGLRATTGRR